MGQVTKKERFKSRLNFFPEWCLIGGTKKIV